MELDLQTIATQRDREMMREALRLAALGGGYTSPNPRVGAVVTSPTGEVWGSGWHRKAGAGHAEVNAVRNAKERGHANLCGATIYVTLEPCCTHGRTPPCTDLIRREGFARVVVAAVDPNPAHAGHGLEILREAGIHVESGLFAAESEWLNRDFNHFMRNGLPWVTAKMALSLDGSIAPRPGDSPWITSAPARTRAHELRHLSDAIIVGAGTVRTDNPRLTIRLPSATPAGPEEPMIKLQPWRVVLTRSAAFGESAGTQGVGYHVFTDEFRARTLVMRNASPRDILTDLAARGVRNVLLEGGSQVHGAFFEAGLVDEVAFFIAPVILGTASPAVVAKSMPRVNLHQVRCEQLGPDMLMTGLIRPISHAS
ncbi:bifunctional diaminohydroxyphosphoribosylaminopyrimidine deaminase/5-amino-6-(5-phosphoribosylamino)uracil reductase RibD [Verrucomicrobia bacterium LW23]|nr:bifunctional diaminohydroxyphosphoribosylaminopyrimidine deaminase/5-amino-6-(5-phosphoribosylamino)uracil reductase RibD [Verrucomicrobia bacterium LW23]